MIYLTFEKSLERPLGNDVLYRSSLKETRTLQTANKNSYKSSRNKFL